MRECYAQQNEYWYGWIQINISFKCLCRLHVIVLNVTSSYIFTRRSHFNIASHKHKLQLTVVIIAISWINLYFCSAQPIFPYLCNMCFSILHVCMIWYISTKLTIKIAYSVLCVWKHYVSAFLYISDSDKR